MNAPGKSKKWRKWLLTLLLVIVAATGVLYYIINYRLKDILQLVVAKESKNNYKLGLSSIEFSLLKKNIVIKNAELFCNDTLNTSPHYTVKIPSLYFAIQSWSDLIFHKKISIDSLSVLNPELTSHEHFALNNKPASSVSFQASAISKNIQQLLLQLEVRSFQIQNASFTASRSGSNVPLVVNNINFSIRNFSKQSADSSRLFSSDDIDLSITDQHWAFPDGRREVKFKRFHFSGQNQFFELDSCSFHADSSGEKRAMSLEAEKIFFNSKQLTALYEQDALLLDTLICYRPVLNIESTTKAVTQQDNNSSASKIIGQFFSNISIGFIDVKDGEISVINKYRPNYQTQKANLRAYNLSITPKNDASITTDSIDLSLKNLAFLTTDSLFQLTVDEFNLKQNDVVFKNAVYAPTAKNNSDKGFSFTAPSLHLKNISLESLMYKKLVADTAELNKPMITVFDKSKTKQQTDSSLVKVKKSQQKKKSFYQTLHGLSELIDVQHFNIIDGNLGYTASGAFPMKMSMKNLDASILLNKLFNSDSLIDIKRSLPEVSAEQITVQSAKVNLGITNYDFKGDRRHNKADEFYISLANGTSVKGKKLYWEVLDWDMYVNHKIVQIDYLKLHELFVDVQKKEQSSASNTSTQKDLPVLNIARIDLDLIHFNDSSAKNTLQFNASGICLDNIGSKKKFFTWNNAEGVVNNFAFNAPGKNIAVEKIIFNTAYETSVRQMKADIKNDKGYTKIDLPKAAIKTDIHSTDFSLLHLPLIEADNAIVDIYKKYAEPKASGIAKPVSIPLALKADKLIVKKAAIKYTNETSRDTIQVTTGINVNADDITTFKKQKDLFQYSKVIIGFNDLTINKGKLDLAVPASTLALLNGNAEKNASGKITLQSAVTVKWTDAAVNLKQTDTTGITANKLSGSFIDESFRYSPGMKMQWQALTHKLSLSNGYGIYKGKDITATAGNIMWNPSKDLLSLRKFSVLPNLDIKQTFSKPNAWQGDYMEIRGEAVDISGIRFNRTAEDSSVTVKKIVLDSISLATTRDKRMPFKHGVEKPMPAEMINTLKMPLLADSLVIKRSKVTVNEIAIKSGKQGTVPLNDINAVITNFKNRGNSKDSLIVVANARLINYKVDKFVYKEAYGDSLSYFFAGVHVSPMALPEFSTVTIPLASIGVDKGNADTLYAMWVGNKYAAVGHMNFYYKGLKVRLLDSKDSNKKSFILSIGNALAGVILHKNNDKTSEMFFLRDREKFIFNYWVKTILAGLSTSAGIKRNKKMLKKYNSVKGQYSLPVLSN